MIIYISMPQSCAPANENNTYTCFEDESLIKIAESYNKKYPKDKIKFDRKKIMRKVLWEEIRNKMMKFTPQCNKDSCLLKNPIVKKINDQKIHEETFRPEIPEEWNGDLSEWLSTLDIQAVMDQYELKYTDFRFIGPVPIDFDEEIIEDMCVSDELCKINLSKLYKKGIRKIGVVFNLDPHYRGGSHWVCMFLDMSTGGIYYFDSVGMKPPEEIKKLMDKLKNQGNDLIMKKILKINDISEIHSEHFDYKKISSKKIKIHSHGNTKKLLDNILIFEGGILNRVVDVDNNDNIILKKNINNHSGSFKTKCFKHFYNKKQFQYKDSECGIYTIHFLEEFLKGKKFNEIVSNKYTDTQMFKKRKEYFRVE